jgi:hypothetical protein
MRDNALGCAGAAATAARRRGWTARAVAIQHEQKLRVCVRAPQHARRRMPARDGNGTEKRSSRGVQCWRAACGVDGGSGGGGALALVFHTPRAARRVSRGGGALTACARTHAHARTRVRVAPATRRDARQRTPTHAAACVARQTARRLPRAWRSRGCGTHAPHGTGVRQAPPVVAQPRESERRNDAAQHEHAAQQVAPHAGRLHHGARGSRAAPRRRWQVRLRAGALQRSPAGSRRRAGVCRRARARAPARRRRARPRAPRAHAAASARHSAA